METSHKVVIIGAGASGLAASRQLLNKNIPHVILEGRDRACGRVCTQIVENRPLEMGASLIHGIDGNPLTELAKEANVDIYAIKFGNFYVSKPGSKNIKGEFFEKTNEMHKLLNKHREILLKEKPVVSMHEVIEHVKKSYKFDLLSRQALDCLWIREIESEFGSSKEALDAAYFDSSEAFLGDEMVMNGYNRIFAPIVAKAPIKLNHKVTSIEQQKDKCVVTTEKNGQFVAEYVICTVPLGVLKKGIVKFSPPLSQNKQQSIQRLGFQALNKVHIISDKAFWQDCDTIYYLPKSGTNHLCYGFNASHNLKHNSMYILVPMSYNIGSKTPEQIRKDVMDLLHEHYPTADVEACRLYPTNWMADPFAYGSYTSFAPGSTPEDVKELARAEGRVLFAGEHTTVDNMATVHGAWISGMRAGGEVLKLLKI